MMLSFKDLLRAALAISGISAILHFGPFLKSIAGAYYLNVIISLIVIAWCTVGVSVSSTTAPREKRTWNIFLFGLFMLAITVTMRTEYRLVNKTQALQEARTRDILTDFSEFDVPKSEWAAINAKEALIKQGEIKVAEQELILINLQDYTLSDLSLYLSLFSGILILYSLISIKESKTLDAEDIQFRLEKKLATKKLEHKVSSREFRKTFLKMNEDSNRPGSKTEAMDEIHRLLESMKVPDGKSPDNPDTNKDS